MKKNVGILGVGSCLPDEIRTNDWWPSKIVQSWEDKAQSRPPESPDHAIGGARLAIEANTKLADDPFKGAVERRVMAANEKASDLETRAARVAIERAKIDPSQIDLLLESSWVPDVLLMSNGTVVHQNLGLSPRCTTIPIDAACNSFMTQLAVAEQMIAGGLYQYALLVQSSTPSRVLPIEQPFSTMFGDGATAVVVGAVGEGKGILARAHRTDGSFGRTLVCTVPGKEWHQEGRAVLHVEDRKQAHRMFLSAGHLGKEVLDDCFAQSGLKPTDVDYFASHMGNVWFRRVVQEHVGMVHARFCDTYPWAGSLTGANIPLGMDVAQREGLLRDGDLVAAYSGGTGIIYSAFLLRWGR